MKIAVFHNLQSGGGKRALYNLTKHLVRGGHVADAFVPGSANETFLPMKEVASTHRVFPIRRTLRGTASAILRRMALLRSSWVDYEGAQKSIAVAINSGPYEVVLSEQDDWTMSPFILKYLTKPVVYYCAQPSRGQEAILAAVSRPSEKVETFNWWAERRTRYIYRWNVQIDKENAKFASYVVTNSYYTREVILGAYGLNAFVSYLGTDIDLFRPADGPTENYVLSVGACSPAKGFDFVVRALGRMDPKRRPRFIVVSNISDLEWEVYLVRLAATLGVDLTIKKCISDSELVRLYNQAKLFVYAPYLEPFGLVVLEAMACGTPVIAVREGGIRESVIHDETGLLVDRDEEAFTQAISELLEDSSKRGRLGRRGLDAVRSFWTWQHAAERLEGHLARCVKLHRA